MGLNDFILYENTIQARAGMRTDKPSGFSGIAINPWSGSLGGLTILSESALKLVPFLGEIENFQGKLYYTDNLGYRKTISEKSLLSRNQLNSNGGDFMTLNEWFQSFGFTVTETGYYNLQVGRKVGSSSSANNQIRISQNNVVQQYHNGITSVNALIPFTVNGTIQKFMFFNQRDVFNFTAGLLYSIDYFTDNAQGFHHEGVESVSLKKINYSYTSSASNGGGDI